MLTFYDQIFYNHDECFIQDTNLVYDPESASKITSMKTELLKRRKDKTIRKHFVIA